jgi:bifunctional DNA-binding transcriptional regulator/antitoxin component of YhaV-PrlF toxin-antitoxin module
VTPNYALMKTLARLDSGGRIPLPANIRRALGLRSDQVLEVRMIGRGRNRRLMILPRFGR